MMRDFGSGDYAVTLGIERYRPTEQFYLFVYGPPLRRAEPPPGEIRFGDYEDVQEVSAETGTYYDDPALIFMQPMRIAPLTEAEEEARRRAMESWAEYVPAPISAERYRRADHVWIDTRRMYAIALETGPLDEVFASLDSCMEGLMAQWGIDVDAHRTLSRVATPASNPGRWITSDDYPREELRRRGQGLVHFRLDVDTEGRPTACHIQRATRSDYFAQVSCEQLMRNAEFLPALNASGNPIASYFATTVRFSMGR